MNKVYDIAIVGGGIAGLSLASSILHSPMTKHLSVALIEALEPPKFDSSAPFSNRTSSLTRTSVRFLQSSKAWDHVNTKRTQRYVDMHVYDGVSDQQIEFHETQEIATMTENFNIQAGLLRALHLTSLEIMSTKVEKIVKPREGEAPFPKVQLANAEQIQAKLLVGADGANSPVRHYAGIQSHGWDYPHHGVVGTLTHEEQDHTIAHQRMMPSGPIAFLPLPGNKASMVWSIHPRLAAVLKALETSTMTKLVNAGFRLSNVDLKYILTLPAAEMESELDWRLSLPARSKHAPPRITHVDNVASFPLKFRHTDTYHCERVVLIGDAAHTIHPLAGQGLNLALLDAASCQKALQYCVQSGGDIGFVGEQVTRDRYWANARVTGVVDKIHKLYAREGSSIVGLRSLGSGLLNKIEIAKRTVMSAVG